MLMQLTKVSFQKYTGCMMKAVGIDKFGMQPSIDCLLGDLAADLIHNSNGD